MVATAPQEPATSLPTIDRWALALRLALALATALWLLAWGRLVAVGFTQPGPWYQDAWLTPGGEAYTDDSFRCGGNALQRGEIVYRTNCTRRNIDGGEVYVTAFDLPRRTATVRWHLPRTLHLSDYFLAAASAPDGGLTLMGSRDQRVVWLRADGTVEDLGTPVEQAITFYGFGWYDGQLDLLYQPQASSEPLELVSYTPDGWSQLRTMPPLPCNADQTCLPLNASLLPTGWAVRYGRAPLRPADPLRVTAEVVLVDPAGTARTVQTLDLVRDPSKATSETDAFTITQEGTFRWFYFAADRSGGGVLNSSGRPLYLLRPDGLLEPVPAPPDGLLPKETPVGKGPKLATLDSSYLLTDNGLSWLPIFTETGGPFEADRAVLFGDRWVALHKTERGISLESRPVNAAATTARSQVLVLGRQAELATLSAYLTPLLQAPDGTYWLLGWRGIALHMDADLQRLDNRNAPDRLRLLFTGFFGFYEGNFHTSWNWLKATGLGLILFAWPLILLVLTFWRRRARPHAGVWQDYLLRAAIACIVLDLLFARWFWTASSYF